MAIIGNEMKKRENYRDASKLENYIEYKKNLKYNKQEIKRFKSEIEKAEEKFNEIKRKFPEDSKEYIDSKNKIGRWQQCLDAELLKRKFIRPNTKEDIEYRENQDGGQFASKLKEVTTPNLDLRFHGTKIYFAEQIIKGGIISSTADRYDGYIKSTDMKGEISASTVETISRTIDCFSDLESDYEGVPAGCIFALLPRDEEDAKYGEELLHLVNLNEHPEQLFGVFTTPENIEKVRRWMSEAGFDPETVYTFEGFLEAVKEKSEIIDKQLKEKSQDISTNDYIESKEQLKTEEKAGYLFGEEDIKELAISKDIRIKGIQQLQEKIKNTITELKDRFNSKKTKESEENTNDEWTSRD